MEIFVILIVKHFKGEPDVTMFVFHTVKCNIFRNRIKSMMSLLICTLLVFLLQIYMQNIVSSEHWRMWYFP